MRLGAALRLLLLRRLRLATPSACFVAATAPSRLPASPPCFLPFIPFCCCGTDTIDAAPQSY